jgi:hypothetical protein
MGNYEPGIRNDQTVFNTGNARLNSTHVDHAGIAHLGSKTRANAFLWIGEKPGQWVHFENELDAPQLA